MSYKFDKHRKSKRLGSFKYSDLKKDEIQEALNLSINFTQLISTKTLEML